MTEKKLTPIRQVEWTARMRGGVVYSKGPLWKRFSIVRTTSGYTVADHEQNECARVTTLAAARAWAGIRVGEQVVRHGN